MSYQTRDLKTGPVAGDGANKTFNYSMLIYDASELAVIKTDVDGVESQYSYASGDFTVTGVGDSSGGTIILAAGVAAPISTDQILTRPATRLEQLFALVEGGGIPNVELMKAIDKTNFRISEINEVFTRTLRGNALTLFNDIGSPVTRRALVYEEQGDGSFTIIPSEYDPDEQVGDAEDFADASEASAIAAASSESNAAVSESNAAASAAAAASSAAEGLYNEVISKDFPDSPFVPLLTEEGALYKIDTSGGNVVVNLDELASYGEDMKYAFVKDTADSNSITINRGGTDTINGGTSLEIIEQYVTYVLIGQESSGEWISAAQAATASQASMPIGTIYENASVSTNPSVLFGFGTWALLGAGKVTVCLDSGDSDFGTLGQTGGEKTIDLSHTHTTSLISGGTEEASSGTGKLGDEGEHEHNVSSSLSAMQSVLQPYIVIYRWYRTA